MTMSVVWLKFPDRTPAKSRAGAVPHVGHSQGVSRLQATLNPAQVIPHMVLLATFALAVIVVIYMPSWMSNYPVTRVSVEGVADLRRQQEVEQLLSDTLSGANYFSVPLEQAYQQVSSLSWVKSVSFKRIWPDAVTVKVQEKTPVALWNEDVLISSDGDVFEARERFTTDTLPLLYGPDALREDIMALYHSFGKVLGKTGLAIHQLKVNGHLTAELRFDSGLVVLVDREDAVYKVKRFAEVYPQLVKNQNQKPVRVDLRYADGMAVKWETPGTENTQEKRA